MKKSMFIKAIAFAVGMAAVGSVQAAQIQVGDTVTVSAGGANIWDPSNLKRGVTISTNGGASTFSTVAGLFDLVGEHNAPSSDFHRLLAFCLEPDADLTKFDNPYVAQDLSASAEAVDAVGISKLWAAYRSSVTDNNSAAAFQLAIWELAYEGGTNLSTGLFQAANSAAKSLAQGWLNSLAGLTETAKNLIVLADNPSNQINKQDMLIQTPLPGTLGLLGLGLLGLGGIRRKKAQ